MNAPTTPPSSRPDGSRSARASTAVIRRQRLPAWLVTLALAVHLLAPGLCLAQMLSMGSLGAICTAAPADGRIAAETPLPDDAGRHALEGCEHCVASAVAIVDGTAAASDLPPPAAAPRVVLAPVLVVSSTAWRPPPRGPPNAA